MSRNNKQAYDRGVSVFSPEGRILQVEYAREAVQNGSPSIGLQTENGVVLAALTPDNRSLKVTESVRKIHRIDDSLGAATTGYIPDGRKLVDQLRITTQQDQLRYDEDPKISSVSKQLADELQESTQTGGHRPFGCSLIIGGIDNNGPSVYEVEPGGTPSEWLAVANGKGREQYDRFFEDEYDESYTVEELVNLAVDGFIEVADEEITGRSIDVASISTDDRKMYQYTADEIEEYL